MSSVIDAFFAFTNQTKTQIRYDLKYLAIGGTEGFLYLHLLRFSFTAGMFDRRLFN